jgi:hypothetical protein
MKRCIGSAQWASFLRREDGQCDDLIAPLQVDGQRLPVAHRCGQHPRAVRFAGPRCSKRCKSCNSDGAERGQPRIGGVCAVQVVEFVEVTTKLADAHQIGGPLGQTWSENMTGQSVTEYRTLAHRHKWWTLRIFAPRIRGINLARRA